jgi:hypothetical protein
MPFSRICCLLPEYSGRICFLRRLLLTVNLSGMALCYEFGQAVDYVQIASKSHQFALQSI